MMLKISVSQTADGRAQVCLDRQRVSFRSQDEARSFVARLEARIRAPHKLPERAAQTGF